MTARTAIFVLGMHRSGTSALARVLSLLGAALPRHLMPPGVGNEAGHWEPVRAVALNEQVLAAADATAMGPDGPPDAWFSTETAASFIEPMQALLREEFGAAPLFVLKDPRSALVFPLWRRALEGMGIRSAAVLISRDPIEVAQSLADRASRQEPWRSWPMDRGGLLWLRYMLAAERHSRGCHRVCVRYDELLADWGETVNDIGRGLGIAWPQPLADAAPDIVQFLDPRHRHQHAAEPLATRGGVWASWIGPAMAALQRGPDEAALDAIAQSIAQTCDAMSAGKALEPPWRPDVSAILAMAAAQAASLRETSRGAEALASLLAARTEAAETAERYAKSLEQALADQRAAHEVTIEYARSLEQAREHAEAYARALQAHLPEAGRPTGPG